MTTLLDAALSYAEHGWQVFPVHSIDEQGRCTCPDPGGPKCSPGKHPRTKQGFKNASDREDMVRYWWGQWPDANIGIATGEASGIWVLDIDMKVDKGTGEILKDGDAKLKAAGLDVHSNVEGCTGGGGRHLIFAWDKDAPPVGCSSGDLPKDCDVRGNGGYIVAPPSVHESGAEYCWRTAPAIGEAPSAPGPDLLRAVLGAGAPAGAHTQLEVPVQERLPQVKAEPLDPELAQALAVIPPACGYEEWLQVSMGLHDATRGSEAGFDLFHGWSARAAGASTSSGKTAYTGEPDCRSKWRSFHGRANPIGRGSLFAIAMRYGFVPKGGQAPAVPATTAWVDLPEWIWSRWDFVPFPIDTGLPPGLDWLRRVFTRLAWCFQVPVDLPVLLGMPIAMAALSGKVVIKVPGETWSEPAVLWTLVAMTSGGRKSPVHRRLIAPARKWERELDSSSAIAKHTAALAVAEMRVAAAMKKCASRACTENEDQGKLAEAALADAMQKVELIKATSIPSQELIAHEATTERLVELMARQAGRVLVSDAEGDIFDVAMGRYSSATPNLGAWLKGYDGDTIKQERVGGDRIVHRPLINVGVATQPEALSFLTDKVANGRGFVARFAVAVVAPVGKEEFLSGREVTDAELAPWNERITELLERPLPTEPDEVTLSTEAYGAFKAWGQALMAGAERIETDEGESPKDAWFRKYPGKVLRIALLLHCLQDDGLRRPEVDLPTMKAALAWGDYLAAQNAALAAVTKQDPALVLAERILVWVARQELHDGTFTRRGLTRALSGGKGRAVQRAADLDAPLAALCEAGWIRPAGKPVSGARGPTAASTAYATHPRLKEALAQHRAREAAESQEASAARPDAPFTRW